MYRRLCGLFDLIINGLYIYVSHLFIPSIYRSQQCGDIGMFFSRWYSYRIWFLWQDCSHLERCDGCMWSYNGRYVVTCVCMICWFVSCQVMISCDSAVCMLRCCWSLYGLWCIVYAVLFVVGVWILLLAYDSVHFHYILLMCVLFSLFEILLLLKMLG